MALLSSSLVIPQEICGLICEDSSLTQSDLYALCLVSRAFRDEAERILNIYLVNLRGKRNIKTFCEKIIASRYLAESLDTLIIHMPPEGNLQVDELSRIMQALHLCTNLKHLHILHDGPKWMLDRACNATQPLILDRYSSFKLETFTNSYFSLIELTSFLGHQYMIDTLILAPERKSAVKSSWHIAAYHLKRLSCSAKIIQALFYPYTPIELEQLHLTYRLDQCVNGERVLIQHLARHRNTLKSLTITRYQNHWTRSRINSLIHNIASQLPDIKFLRILDLTKSTSPWNTQIFPKLCNFTQLETLILQSAMMDTPRTGQDSSTPYMPSISAYPDLWTAQGRLRLATKIMRTLPTLRRFVLIEKTLSEYTRDDLSRVVKLSAPTSEKDPNEWPKYDNNIAAYRELWKSQWCH